MVKTTEDFMLEKAISEGRDIYYPEKSLGLAENYEKRAGLMTGLSALTSFMGTLSDYSSLRFDALQKGIEARQIGIVAEDEANVLRNKVINDISNTMAGFGARGITAGSGTPMQIAETEMMNVGDDIQQLRRTAKMKQTMASAEQKMLKSAASTRLTTGLLTSALTGYGAYQTYQGLSGDAYKGTKNV